MRGRALNASGFRKELDRWAKQLGVSAQVLWFNTANAVKNSITDGSTLTGAPGQPVDTGTLKGSWQLEIVGPQKALIATGIAYAPAIEYGSRSRYDAGGKQPERPKKGAPGYRAPKKSTVGGTGSVRQTRANWDKLLKQEALALKLDKGLLRR